MLVITPGEPAGIGPDLVIQLAQQVRAQDWVVVADPSLLQTRAAELGLPLVVRTTLATPTRHAGELTVDSVPLMQPVVAGLLNPANASYVLSTLERAIDLCLGQADFAEADSAEDSGPKPRCALVTGPVQKSVINEAGVPFSGHTEMLAERSGASDVVMLLVAGELRVALATTHLPLREVPDAITPKLLTRRLTILYQQLQQRFGIAQPRLLVAGLNPHAGEGGHLGKEEIEVITPVCDALRAQGMQLQGPLPADTLFTPSLLAQADAVLAMYHDQGLPVLKHVGFGEAVNVTLGLPFVRTSVDHGTALDLAGTGRADVGSLVQALALAGTLLDREGAS